MNPRVLPKDAWHVVRQLEGHELLREWILAEGTSLAVRLGFAFVLLCLASAAQSQSLEERGLRLSVPYVNNFYLQPAGEPDAKVNTGFWGFGVGLLFGHTQSQYVGLSGSVATDIGVPVPAAVDYIGEHEFMTGYALDLTNNHVWRRFSFGYGLSYGSNRWKLDYFDDPQALPPTRDPIELRSESLGLVFPVYYLLNDRFALGLVYRPYLYRFGSEAGFLYEHVMSIDVAWHLELP